MGITRRKALQGASAVAVLSGCKATGVARDRRSPDAHIEDLRVDYIDCPLGTSSTQPLLSWKMRSERQGARQVAYRVRVAGLWDSGRIESSRSVAIRYEGPALASRTRAQWIVEVWDERGRQLVSQPSWWEMGLLAPEDWRADWLVAEDADTLAERSVGLHWIWGAEPLASRCRFRWSFDIHSRPIEALLFISAKDTLTGLWVDGDQLLHPEAARSIAWGMFTKLDLTVQFAKPAEYVIALEVMTRKDQPRPVLGGAVVGYLRLKYADGRIERWPTSETWRTIVAPAEKDTGAWTKQGFNDSSWSHAQSVREPPACHPWLPAPAVVLRTDFAVERQPIHARLYATALGAYEAQINGEWVSARKIAPESTDFRTRALYQTYDVTALVRTGGNAIAFTVGDGWYGSKFSTSTCAMRLARRRDD